MWIGETVYFLSDRGGEFNLYAYDLKTRNVVRRTRHEGFPVESASAGAGRIIYEQAGYLHLFNPGTNDLTRLKIGVAADLAEFGNCSRDLRTDPTRGGVRRAVSFISERSSGGVSV
jgi:tricorn protease